MGHDGEVRVQRAAPGKRTATMNIVPRAAGSPAVQRQPHTASRAAGDTHAALTAQWMDTAMRPDVHPAPVQRMSAEQAANPPPEPDAEDIHHLARQGIAGAASPLPHLDRIQSAFGAHGVQAVEAHVGGPATGASQAMGAEAYATGNHVAFARTPDLHTAAHEAAHVVQQRAGVHLDRGVGASGDAYEQHADRVADQVVAGGSAQALLDEVRGSGGAAAVQRAPETAAPGADNGHIVYGAKEINDRLAPNDAVNQRINALLACLREVDHGKRRRNDKNDLRYGYMVGVAQCVDESFIVAASGSDRVAFQEAVGRAFRGTRYKLARKIVHDKDNQRKFTRFAGGEPRTEKIDPEQKSYGDCAAPKMLHHAQRQDATKTPIALVEKWFQPAKKGADQGYSQGMTVAPCDEHCADLLPFMLEGRADRAAEGEQQLADKEAEAKLQKKLDELDWDIRGIVIAMAEERELSDGRANVAYKDVLSEVEAQLRKGTTPSPSDIESLAKATVDKYLAELAQAKEEERLAEEENGKGKASVDEELDQNAKNSNDGNKKASGSQLGRPSKKRRAKGRKTGPQVAPGQLLTTNSVMLAALVMFLGYLLYYLMA